MAFMRLFALVVFMLGAGLTPAMAAATPPTLLVMGDSLSAAYGIALDKGWVALLQSRLREQGYAHQVVNASISGETTAGGLARLPQALDTHQPAVVLIELAANDGLRGQSLKAMRDNLAKMIQLSRQSGARVALFEMQLPVNYGPKYTGQFNRELKSLAKSEKIPLVPFFLAPIASKPQWFLDDGLHPNEKAQPLLLDAVWSHIKPLLH